MYANVFLSTHSSSVLTVLCRFHSLNSLAPALYLIVLLMFLCFAFLVFFGAAVDAAKCIEFCEFCFAANTRIQGQMTSAKHFSCSLLLLLVSGARHKLWGDLGAKLFGCYLRLCFLLIVGFCIFFFIFSFKKINICTAAKTSAPSKRIPDKELYRMAYAFSSSSITLLLFHS